MIAKETIDLLCRKLGKDNVAWEKEDLLVLGYDSTPGLHHLPDIVVYPTTTEEIQAAMEIAYKEGWPITPRGSGT